MALNFPANPTPNQIWTDPSNGYTYQWKIDPESPVGQDLGKWVTNISRPSGSLDSDYLRLDGANGPITGNLGVEGYVNFNSGSSPDSFVNPLGKGNYGESFTSRGDGTTEWRSHGTNPGPTPPIDPYSGQLWYDTLNTQLKHWCDLGSGFNWEVLI